MGSPPPDDALLARYLTGACSDEEKARIEEQFFADDDAFARLCQVEDDLVERYARGDLSAGERSRFEQAYGAPPRRDRVLFALALHRAATGDAAEGAPAQAPLAPASSRDVQTWSGWWRRWATLEPLPLRLALAAASLILVAAVALSLEDARRLRLALDTTRQEVEALQDQADGAVQHASELEQRVTALAEQLRLEQAAREALASRPAARPVIATFALSPGLTRSPRGPLRVRVPREADTVRLELDLEADAYRRFRAELRTAAGELAWSQDGLEPAGVSWGRIVPLAIPAALLSGGEYELRLRGGVASGGFEDAGYYYFEVVR